MNTQTWIKRSEREPGAGDVPVVYGHYRSADWIESSAQCVWHAASNLDYTHWRSIKCDPPPRELTQRERDAATINNIVVSYRYSGPQRQVAEAIYAERREVLRALQDAHGQDWGTDENWAKHAQKLRARLDEQGAK